MDLLQHALAGATHDPSTPLPKLQRVLVVGGGGTLGSAVLAEALVAGRHQRVATVVTGAITSAMRGFETLDDGALRRGPQGFDLAYVVFERSRHANGRDDAFLQPEPDDLLPVAQALRAGGVQQLVVVVPHAPALLPHALKAGFATQAEHAVAALGFRHLVFLRAAQAGRRDEGGTLMQRFGAWWLAQLSWMVPTSDQPVRAVRLAALVVQLGRLLPAATPGTRVLPPEVLWQAAQAEDAAPVLAGWLAGR
jgi:hypothetical protein